MLPRVIRLSPFSRTREILGSQLCSKMQKLIFGRTIVNFVKIFQFFFIVGREELLALFIFSSICLFINPFVIKSSEFVLFLMKTQAYIL